MTPQQARNLKIGIGVVAGLGLLYLIFKKSDNGGSGSDNTGNNGSNVGGGSGVFSVKDATAKLYELMRYSGSDEKKIVNFFRYITPVQFAAINKEFGSRQYNKTLGNQINPIGWFTELPFEPLSVWLENELSDSEFENLQRKYPNVL